MYRILNETSPQKNCSQMYKFVAGIHEVLNFTNIFLQHKATVFFTFLTFCRLLRELVYPWPKNCRLHKTKIISPQKKKKKEKKSGKKKNHMTYPVPHSIRPPRRFASHDVSYKNCSGPGVCVRATSLRIFVRIFAELFWNFLIFWIFEIFVRFFAGSIFRDFFGGDFCFLRGGLLQVSFGDLMKFRYFCEVFHASLCVLWLQKRVFVDLGAIWMIFVQSARWRTTWRSCECVTLRKRVQLSEVGTRIFFCVCLVRKCKNSKVSHFYKFFSVSHLSCILYPCEAIKVIYTSLRVKMEKFKVSRVTSRIICLIDIRRKSHVFLFLARKDPYKPSDMTSRGQDFTWKCARYAIFRFFNNANFKCTQKRMAKCKRNNK